MEATYFLFHSCSTPPETWDALDCHLCMYAHLRGKRSYSGVQLEATPYPAWPNPPWASGLVRAARASALACSTASRRRAAWARGSARPWAPHLHSTSRGLTQCGTTCSHDGFIDDSARVPSARGDLAFLLGDCGTPPQFFTRKLFLLAPVPLRSQPILRVWAVPDMIIQAQGWCRRLQWRARRVSRHRGLYESGLCRPEY